MPALQPITLSTLTRTISKVIEANFYNRTYWVTAEIINLRFYPQKGYYFLDLVEKDPLNNAVLTSIKANAWSQAVKRIAYFERVTGQKFDNNIKVLVLVGVEYHISYGLKLNILDVDPAFTIGHLEQQKQATLQRLLDENPGLIRLVDGDYQTHNKSLAVAPVFQTIALLGSPGSDGYNDFRHELEHNQFGYRFRVDDFPVQVQGVGMETLIINKLASILISETNYDAVVIVRGGGSQTDFLIFDTYELARAVASFPIPVITGLGHTRNESLTDLMAFMATKTPTKVAQAIIAHNRGFEEQVFSCRDRLFVQSARILERENRRLTLAKVLVAERAKENLYEAKMYLASVKSELRRMTSNKLMEAWNSLKMSRQLVKYLSPSTFLKRGYALVYQGGKPVIDSSSILPGSVINILMHNATINSSVIDVTTNDEDFTNI